MIKFSACFWTKDTVFSWIFLTSYWQLASRDLTMNSSWWLSSLNNFFNFKILKKKKTQMFIVFFKYVSTICFIHFQSVEKWNWWTKTKNETQNILLVSRFIVVTVYFKIFKILENSWKELNYLKGRDVRCVLPKSSQYNLNHSNPEFEKWKWWRRLNYFNYLKILCSVPASSHLEHILFI